MGILYIVSTPIGNLKDITLRALEILKEVDLILAEDTRITKKLLFHYGIEKPLKSYHKFSSEKIYEFVVDLLRNNEKIALVSDAGTPGISDEGPRLVSFIKQKMPEVKIIPIPGVSALITALSVVGVNADKFTFLGYPPHKKGREKFFRDLLEVKTMPLVLYESPHRLLKTFDLLKKNFGEAQKIIVAKELTKLYEEIWKGSLEDAGNYFVKEKGKGEFVLILD